MPQSCALARSELRLVRLLPMVPIALPQMSWRSTTSLESCRMPWMERT